MISFGKNKKPVDKSETNKDTANKEQNSQVKEQEKKSVVVNMDNNVNKVNKTSKNVKDADVPIKVRFKYTVKDKAGTTINGFFDAYSKIQEIFKSATKKLIIVDNYADNTILDIIKRRFLGPGLIILIIPLVSSYNFK